MDPQYQQPQTPQNQQVAYAPQQSYVPPAPSNGGGNFKDRIVEIILGILLVATIGFGVWAFMQYQDQKNNVNSIAGERVEEALAEQKTELETEFTKRNERVVNTYTSPSEFGSISFKYPRDWSIYIEESRSNDLLSLFADSSIVREGAPVHGVRLELVNDSYSEVLDDYSRNIEDGSLRSSVFKASGETGVKLVGEIEREMQGTIVILPLRDRTIKFWTESDQFDNVYNQALETLTFTP